MITASGRGCDPGSPVSLSIGSSPVANAVAREDGAFEAPVTVPLPVGRYQVVATCGPTLETTLSLSVVLTSHAGPPTATAAILLILLLIVLVATKWQLLNR